MSFFALPESTVYAQTSQSNQTLQFLNFATVNIHQHLGDNKTDIISPIFPFRGDVSDAFTFTISNTPTGGGYLLAQVYDSLSTGHTIIINDQEIPTTTGNFGSTGSNWGTLMAMIGEGILQQGQNTIQFTRNPDSTDNLLIDNVVINWHQQIPSGLTD